MAVSRPPGYENVSREQKKFNLWKLFCRKRSLAYEAAMFIRQKYRQRKSDEDLLDDALRFAMGTPSSKGDDAFEGLLQRLREAEEASEASEKNS
ncbi:hypothetical protein GQ651_03870 [Alphaproteobacteria bacterium GH1-50]|uniref:Uncharacterized protein n=1 Tax=Kangsaoukella pontilimi TaxID=2691042 RepID=A0A7C9MYS8_9RHOB|nr:hypothetical protein [Kangsaoukella pontilimi]MXQ06978.1 hypothetical protein [Kangsaoukella pontilimi]